MAAACPAPRPAAAFECAALFTGLAGTALPPKPRNLLRTCSAQICLAQPCPFPLGVLSQPHLASRCPRHLSVMLLPDPDTLAQPCPNLVSLCCHQHSPAWPLSLDWLALHNPGSMTLSVLRPVCPQTCLSCLGKLEE